MTAPKPSDSRGHNGTWHVLAELSVPSEPSNERHATEVVAGAIKDVGLAGQRLERLKTAVAEATMNAMEHGNHYRSGVPVELQVLTTEQDLLVRITDRGSGGAKGNGDALGAIARDELRGEGDSTGEGRFGIVLQRWLGGGA